MTADSTSEHLRDDDRKRAIDSVTPGLQNRRRRAWSAVALLVSGVVTASIGAVAGAVAIWVSGVGPPPPVVRALSSLGVSVVSGQRAHPVSKSQLFDERLVSGIYERAAPAIVEISVTAASRRGSGSGVLVEPAGTVLTNYHVVRDATRIEVTLLDRTRMDAVLVGSDPQDDIALLRLINPPQSLTTLTLGDSDVLKPGAMAIAIGNPIGLDRSISVGVIAAVGRTLRDGNRPLRNILQTDAALNPGNSGGALLDATGQVIGVTNAIERIPGRQGFGGVGFAVPSSSVRRFFSRMLAGERIAHPYVGISGQDTPTSIARELGLSPPGGVAITSVSEGGPAARAGIVSGDIVTAIDGYRLRTLDDLGSFLDRTYRPDDQVVFQLRRSGREMKVPLTLGAWPDSNDPS